MEPVVLIAQITVALGIINVWLLRSDKPTSWRGGDAGSMKEEFAVYGLPPWSVRVIGALKLSLAALLLAGIWFPSLAKPAAAGVGLLMLGAVAMHLRVRDPIRRSLPAFSLLVLSTLIAVAA